MSYAALHNKQNLVSESGVLLKQLDQLVGGETLWNLKGILKTVWQQVIPM